MAVFFLIYGITLYDIIMYIYSLDYLHNNDR